MLNLKYAFFKWVPAILWGLFISWATLKPSSHSTLNIPIWAASLHLDKWVHFGFWFIWTFIFLKNVKPDGIFTVVSLVFFSAYGGFIELLQGSMNLGRTCDFWDWMADTAGVLAVPIYFNLLEKFWGSQKRPA